MYLHAVYVAVLLQSALNNGWKKASFSRISYNLGGVITDVRQDPEKSVETVKQSTDKYTLLSDVVSQGSCFISATFANGQLSESLALNISVSHECPAGHDKT